MNPPSTLEYLTAIGAIATPILVLLLTGVGWLISHRLEKARERETKEKEEARRREEKLRDEARELEEKLREYRADIYDEILEPFVILFTKDEGLPKVKDFRGKTNADVAVAKALSLEYRQAAFKFLLVGSDRVIRAYNNLMQFFYTQEGKQTTEEITKDMMTLLGIFLLEIRKSVGNEATGLHHFEMLEFLIKDVRKYQEGGKYLEPTAPPNKSLDRRPRSESLNIP
jgi:hypothetical protein